jgi:hypothetical protein
MRTAASSTVRGERLQRLYAQNAHSDGEKIGRREYAGKFSREEADQAKAAYIEGLKQNCPNLFKRQRLLNSFKRGFEKGVSSRVEKEKVNVRRDACSRLNHCSDINTWHQSHGLARASSKPVYEPGQYQMKFPRGAASQQAKIDYALDKVLEFEALRGDEPADMRPLMHAGFQLAQACGGDRIKPSDAIALLNRLCETAQNGAGSTPLDPDRLRMVVAGLTAVWDQSVSNEVALAFLEKNVTLTDDEQEKSIQAKAVAQGFGIGMGWKGMALINQSVAKKSNSAGEGEAVDNHSLLQEMQRSQRNGIGWLLRLEAEIPGMSGAAESDQGFQKVEAMNILRKHQALDLKGDADAAAAVNQAGPTPTGLAGTMGSDGGTWVLQGNAHETHHRRPTGQDQDTDGV